ncbi:hypothetical protein BCR32DRAFT_327422, partial [Anaeromyces robustus]
MKLFNVLLCVITLLISVVYAAKKKEPADDFYIVTVNNTESDLSKIVEEIHTLIIDNKDTYEDQEAFEEIEKDYEEEKEKSRELILMMKDFDSPYVNVVAHINDDITVLQSYLSKKLVPKVKEKKYVISCNKENLSVSIDETNNSTVVISPTSPTKNSKTSGI